MTRSDQKGLEIQRKHLDREIEYLEEQIANMSADKDDCQSSTLVTKEVELRAAESRREQIIAQLQNAEVVEAGTDYVSIGSIVLVQFEGQPRPTRLQISLNGDAGKGRIIPESPIAKALLEGVERSGVRAAAKEGDVVVASTPRGPTNVKLLRILAAEEA